MGIKNPTVLETNMMLVNSITKGWFCMAMLVYETVSFVIFVTRFFLIGTFHYPKKIGCILNQCDFFSQKDNNTNPPVSSPRCGLLSCLIMSRLETVGFPPTKDATGEVSWGRELANLLREGAVIQEWDCPNGVEVSGPVEQWKVWATGNV